jgi:pimeloyl-ACP methyl ester carboxylesterase
MVSSGCGEAVRFLAQTQQDGDRSAGLTFYLGGAGPIGHVGSIDVPGGFQDAGYGGEVDVFTWQGLTHAGDQMNISRNRSKAAELAAQIRRYRRQYPKQKINIIALSAGTGIATFALEYLPEGIQIDRAVFLGCSLSSGYDLTRALRRIRGGLYVVHSEFDPILKNVVWYTGTVDRASGENGIAGLVGFDLPDQKGPDTERQYAKLHNVPYRYDFTDYGYQGGHTDCTSREFIAAFIAPAVMGNDRKLIGEPVAEWTVKPQKKQRREPSTLTSAPPATAHRIRDSED